MTDPIDHKDPDSLKPRRVYYQTDIPSFGEGVVSRAGILRSGTDSRLTSNTVASLFFSPLVSVPGLSVELTRCALVHWSVNAKKLAESRRPRALCSDLQTDRNKGKK
jgi:hypothetical protein